MARSTSTRKTRTARNTTARSTRRPSRSTSNVSVPATETRRVPAVSDKRTLKYFNFQYNRDDAAHARGANSVTITDRSNSGDTISLSLSEARSLYNFLSDHLRSR